ncbi:hypothetical protein KC19_VG253900 [Ceratodon purpureus]|uniref:Uncharacterized protein n=1 Tax=Ceratodon purpureus TaxID=3225 RepID=A0A8T0HV29_CERPU|nr:hypothetical protein KC19_VG253900 [Ceratodon purpureus]
MFAEVSHPQVSLGLPSPFSFWSRDPPLAAQHAVLAFPSSSLTPLQPPTEWAWIPVAHNINGTGIHDAVGGLSPANFPLNWHLLNAHARLDFAIRHGFSTVGNDKGSPCMSSCIKEDSIKRQVQRTNKQVAEEDARRRESSGLKPFTLQVKSFGIISSGCAGHLKWQEYVRDLTSQMLDMSMMKFKDQNDNSKAKLCETLRSKFEFLEHDVTDLSLNKMIKNWLRKDRELMKRLHGGKFKALSIYSEKEWDALKRYWESLGSRLRLEKMLETRKKVVCKPRIGCQGYAGKASKLVRDSTYLFRFSYPTYISFD